MPLNDIATEQTKATEKRQAAANQNSKIFKVQQFNG
jgi:hypothetical protein